MADVTVMTDMAVRKPTPFEARNKSLLGRLLGLSETRYWAYLLLAPALVLIVVMILLPLVSGVATSFSQTRLNRPAQNKPFIGLTHYAEMLEDPVFRTALGNTTVWVIAGASIQLVVGLAVALGLNRPLPGIRAIRVLVLLPWLMPSVVASHMWALMLDTRLGVINDVLVRLGLISAPHSWFADPNTALPTAILVEVWRTAPFFSLLLLAALQTIPHDLYEAAEVDGANIWNRFRWVTLPMLMPVIVATVVVRIIGLVNSPDVLLILTQGGPGNATQVLSLYAFRVAYTKLDFGYAAALSTVMMLLLLVFTIIYIRVSGITKE
jgi:multiple sugar transport system permease protein